MDLVQLDPKLDLWNCRRKQENSWIFKLSC